MRLKSLFQISSRVNISDAAAILHMSKQDLVGNLKNWKGQLVEFTLTRKFIIVAQENNALFIEQLDAQFQNWAQAEKDKIKGGKKVQ